MITRFPDWASTAPRFLEMKLLPMSWLEPVMSSEPLEAPSRAKWMVVRRLRRLSTASSSGWLDGQQLALAPCRT
jgi:hypothetical protein